MSDLDRARALFFEGITCFEDDQFEKARDRFEAALALAPGRASVLGNLGVTQMKLGQWSQAADALERSLASDPTHAEHWVALALSRQRLGLLPEALQAFERALALDPEQTTAWGESGCILRELNQPEKAIVHFERALSLAPEHSLYRYYLSALRGQEGPLQPPRTYVENLFDQYAEDFDSHLVDSLQYRGHRHLIDHLPGPPAARFGWVLDLGCGTGLSGPLIRPRTDHLCGIDLAAGMIEQARRTGLYDHLEQTDANEFLARCPTRWDLILATDVLIYMGALDELFAHVERRLAPGGCLAFTAELCEDCEVPNRPKLMPSLRYAHPLAYLQDLAKQHGLQWLAHHEAPLRLDQGRPLPALYAYLRKP